MRNLRDREIYDNELRRQAQIDRENSSAAGGVAVGIAIAGLVGAGIAAYALLNRQPAEAPRQNTVIERTREVVPVPQPKAPEVKAPDINITVPSPAPANSSPESDAAQPESNAQPSSGSDSATSSPDAAPASQNP
ncbi:hypothetical protein [Leptolyngbya ohadii]|uniref:hypothetical protein n=1 Tax=Leptolyngbya ohadii TaxID=1962290 RepID=UPI000B59DB6C|nr:hypothetical protein [Leptolyngbya ohadii]